LGSCVATCLFDPVARIGGLNHFLLPEPPDSHDPAEVDVHYGVYLMEILINDMLRKGASKAQLRAHLYGGANLRAGMAPIGTANAEFARAFLDRERIPLLREDLGGNQARRIEFRPATGKVRCRVVENRLASEAAPPPRPTHRGGDVDVVLTDINMPRLDGFGLIEQLRCGSRHRDRPILVLTTESSDEKKLRAR